MKKLLRKDKKKRILLMNVENNRFVLKNVLKNNNLTVLARWKTFSKLSRTSKDGSNVRIINRCILTGRRKRINQMYSFSRLMFLKLARFGYFNGVFKSS